VAALVAVGATGADIVVLRCGLGWDRAVHQPARGWSDEDWLAATARLVRRELLDADGRATEAGRAVVAEAEEITNQAAAPPWEVLAPGEILEVACSLSLPAHACRELSPEVTPIGDLRLWDVENDPEYLDP
jgi:type II secretory pathway component PulL